MKRSNRLVLLVGVFLAVIAFVGVLLLSQSPTTDPNAPPTEATVVVAAEDIPLGTVIEEAMVTTETVPIDGALPGYFTATSEVIGQIARQEVLTGQQITTAVTNQGQVPTNVTVPNGYRAVSVLVDQLTGVGTLIQTGDYVDVLVRFEIQPNDIDEDTGVATPVQGIDTTSTKLLIQGMQVIGVVRPPPPAPPAEGATPPPGTTLSGQQELVILSATPAQAEALKFVEDPEGRTVTLVLRSPEDFIDANGNPLLPESPCITAPLPTATPPTVAESPAPSPEETQPPYRGCETTEGVVLSTLVFNYGVLVPSITGEGPVPVIPNPTVAPTEAPTASPAP